MNNQTIEPMGEYILLSVCEDDNASDALILNTTNTSELNKGIVKAIGDKVNTDKESTQVKVEDKVVFIPNSGIKLTNSEYSDILISVKNIIGIIKGE